MTTDDELEANQLAQMEADLLELSGHVETWLNDRFLSAESPDSLNLVDVTGLITWLEQWRTKFDSYADTASALAEAGQTAAKERLAQIHREIDASIANFMQMAGDLPAELPPEPPASPAQG